MGLVDGKTMVGHRKSYARGTPESRFWAKVEKGAGPDDCWLWKSVVTPNGYGLFRLSTGKKVYAHRFSYESAHGQIPEGCDVDHLCRVRHCVNPKHLEAVSRRVNLMRGKTHASGNAAKTHCPNGHSYDQANTYNYRGARQCRLCRKEHDRNRQPRNKGAN